MTLTQMMGADKQSSNVPYVIAVVVMGLACIVFILLITLLRPAVDNTVLITNVIGFISTITVALLAFMKSQQTHDTVNSRTDQLMAMIRQAAFNEGIAEARRPAEVLPAISGTGATTGTVSDPPPPKESKK